MNAPLPVVELLGHSRICQKTGLLDTFSMFFLLCTYTSLRRRSRKGGRHWRRWCRGEEGHWRRWCRGEGGPLLVQQAFLEGVESQAVLEGMQVRVFLHRAVLLPQDVF
jgi:hypothetical protein